MQIANITCFIFDLDGTLVFNEHVNAESYRAAFANVGLKISAEEYGTYFGLGVGDMLAAYAEHHKIHATPELLDQLIAAKAIEYKKRLHLMEQNHAVVGLLRALSPHYHTALATTSSRHNGLAVLEAFGLSSLFDLTIFREDVSQTKPNPECHHIIAKHFNVRPTECVIFEDSASGLKAAEAFGAHICKVVR